MDDLGDMRQLSEAADERLVCHRLGDLGDLRDLCVLSDLSIG